MSDQPQIVASDLEGTLSAGVTWEGIRDYLQQHDYGRSVRLLMLKRLPGILLYRSGKHPREQAFKENWVKGMLSLCAGFTTAQMVEMADWVVTRHLWPAQRPAVMQELQEHQANGRSVYLVSGVFQPILEAFAHKAGFAALGTPLAYENGRFIGHPSAPMMVREQKVQALRPLLGTQKLVAAYGDTINDVPMLSLSHDPVAVHPDDALRQKATAAGWRILE